MTLVHGQRITAEEIERIVSRRFTPQAFASLCNAVAWASSRRRCSSLPSFTERVNVKDGGIDAEWQAELPDDDNYSSPLLGPGWNVFQYKRRDIFAAGREQAFSSLKAGLKGAARDLSERTSRRPDRYVLFANLDLTHFTPAEKAASPQEAELRESVLEGYDRPDDVHVEIVGAAELAALLNDCPHLRSAYFTPDRFSTWERSWADHRQQKPFGKSVELVGRATELEEVRFCIDDPNVRAVVLCGPADIGKTRLALEATKHRSVETVVALEPSMSVSDLLALKSSGEPIVIVEDPEPQLAQAFVDQALANSDLKLLITFPTMQDAPRPSFGRDNRVQIIQVKSFSELEAGELLKAAGAAFDYGLASWIIEQAGGTPGILLAAASLGPELRREASVFVDEVGTAFEGRVRRELGDRAIDVLRLLSLLTHVGVRGVHANEINLICTIFGGDLNPNAVLNYLPRLQAAGLVYRRGSYVEVRPPVLANRLAASALLGRSEQLLDLLCSLDPRAKSRLARRLQALGSDEAKRLGDALCSPHGLLINLHSALAFGYLLRLATATVPERAARLIEDGLKAMALDERLLIRGDARRELMWILDELLFRKKTSAVAIRCLALLAEAETESWANNATGVLCECFHPRHPQVPLPLQERLTLIKWILSPEHSAALRIIGVKAIESSLRRTISVALRRGSGAQPLDTRPSVTFGEIWDYIEAEVDLVMAAAKSEEAEVAQSARNALPRVLAECAIQIPPQRGVPKLESSIGWILEGEVALSVSDFADALRLVLEVFHQRRNEAEGERRLELEEYVRKIGTLMHRLDQADFPTRLKRWAGNRTRAHDEYEVDSSGRRVYRGEKELRALAEEVVDSPAALTDELLIWLCSDEAGNSWRFFSYLGMVDLERTWLSSIERVGASDSGATAFAAYFGAVGRADPGFVGNRLDELTQERRVTAEAIVRATGHLGGDSAGIQRVETLISEKRVNPVDVERTLVCWGFIDSLSPEEYLRLLKAIAGPDLENAVAAIDFLGMWLHDERPIEGELVEFAWRCLEAAPTVSFNEHYDCDQLASKLAQADIERGFHLLEKLLMQPHDSNSWNPLERHGQNRFWDVLRKADAEHAFRVVFSLALTDPFVRFRVTWHLPQMIDQENDADSLVAFALESEEKAELVCQCITSGRPGFWPIALRIIATYPSDRRIQSALASAVEQMGSVIWGPQSAHLEKRREEVVRVQNDPATPRVARPWLEQLEERLSARRDHEVLSERDEQVDRF